MREQKITRFWLLFVLGLLLIAASIIFKGVLAKQVCGVFIGLGSVLGSVSIAQIIKRSLQKKDPEYRRITRIEEADERNAAITNRAKAKAFDFIAPLFCGVALVTVLLRAELIVTLLIVGGYATIQTIYFVYLSKYNKKM